MNVSKLGEDKSSLPYTPSYLNEVVQKKSILYIFCKRSLDILGASIGIIVLSWLLFIIIVAIKIDDPKGPIFFKQQRVGKNEQKFYMFKFRSMVTNAEAQLESLLKYNEINGAMFKMKHDPRITRVGRFIRKTSIDELPQLWNVLKGDMSLVGPRPPLNREVKLYSDYDKLRLLVTPGCTGLWQVSGRSNIGFKEMVELDLKYIEKRTILYDIKIILKTVIMLFSSKGAY
ncbi:multidrug MFS transporter [Priestia megaterium]|uniref:sugar transferase n=1 Tax=Priestia megaterium TaxID=1404 RepID=UPI000BF557EB|nr:multidrug MFS transporter [Priestia megaterium]